MPSAASGRVALTTVGPTAGVMAEVKNYFRPEFLNCIDAAVAELAKAVFDPVYGARPLKRAIQSELENPLAREILSGRFAPKDVIRVDVEGGRFVFENVIEAEVV